MATWASTQSGNWSRASNNADSPWYDGGAQTALATVPGASGTDSVTITAGHTVTYDYNMSGGNLSGLTINGTLQASTSAGTYLLTMDGVSGHNITFGAAGYLLAGSAGTPYPSTCTFTINLGTSSGIDCASGPSGCLALYCTEPTWNMVRIGAEAAGQTQLDITGYRRSSDGVIETGQDLTTDATWAAGRTVYVVHVRAGNVDTEARTISAVGSNYVTVSVGLTNAKTAGSYVALSWRNVRIIGHNTTAGAVRNGTGAVLNCEIALGSSGVGTNAGTGYAIGAGCIHGGNRGIIYGAGHTVQGSATITGCTSGIFYGAGHTVQGSATITGCANGIYYGAGHTVQGSATITGCTYGIIYGAGHTVQGSATITGCLYGIRNTSCTINATGVVLSNNTADLYGDSDEVCVVRGVGASLNSTTQYSGYRSCLQNEAIQTVIWDIGGVDGAVKAWMYGGTIESVATKPTNWPAGVDWTETYRHTLEAATHRCWLEKPIYARDGVPIQVDVYIKQSATGMAVPAVACLVGADDSVPVPLAALDSATIAENTDWQKLTLTYTPTYDRELRLRVYAANGSGTVLWREVVTFGSGGVRFADMSGGMRG